MKSVQSVLIQRKALIPAWIVAFGLIAVFGDPISPSMRALLLFVGVVGPAIIGGLWREPPQTVAEVLRDAETAAAERQQGISYPEP